MFTGIIESIAIITDIEQSRDNLILTFDSELTSELKIDQSISHNGICLTSVYPQGTASSGWGWKNLIRRKPFTR